MKTAKMQTYGIVSQTNNGKMFHVVNTTSKEKALRIAEKEGAWEYAEIHIIDISKPGCTFNSID